MVLRGPRAPGSLEAPLVAITVQITRNDIEPTMGVIHCKRGDNVSRLVYNIIRSFLCVFHIGALDVCLYIHFKYAVACSQVSIHC